MAFSLIRLSTTYQATAMPATHQVETSGVRYRGWILARPLGRAWRRAIDRPVREAGMMVVCVEAIADVATASRTIQLQPERLVGDQTEEELLLLGVVGEEGGADESGQCEGGADVGDQPSARVVHENVVPQSVSTLLR